MQEQIEKKTIVEINQIQNPPSLVNFLVKAIEHGWHQTLSVNQRSVLGLRYGAGLSLQEVGLQLQRTKGTVWQIEENAWKKLIPNFPAEGQKEIKKLLRNRLQRGLDKVHQSHVGKKRSWETREKMRQARLRNLAKVES